MKKAFLLFLFIPCYLLSETSVFDNKGIESKKKYGFSETEEYIYDNKKEIDRVISRLYDVEKKVNSYETTYGGFKEIVRSNSQKISKAEKSLYILIEKVDKLETSIKNIEEQLSDIGLNLEKQKIDNEKQVQFNETAKANDLAFEKKTNELITSVDLLKKTVVTKDEVKEIIQKLIDDLEATKKENKEIKKLLEFSKPELFFKDKKPEDIYEEAIEFLKKKSYQEARVRLFYLLNHTDYQKPRVLYNIGELEYKEKNYKDAAESFKASGSLDPKASYMSVLLYHAGISYQNINDNENAAKFFKTLIEHYPKSELIKGAKSRLKKVTSK